MRTAYRLSFVVIACMLIATTAFGLGVEFGPSGMSSPEPGCVKGYVSSHCSGTYHQGDTASLNEHLQSLIKEDPQRLSMKVILHAGANKVDAPLDDLLLGVDDPVQIAVDWSVRRHCPTEKYLAGTCSHSHCKEYVMVVDIWVANEIKLSDLLIPKEFQVESAAEIEQFVKPHAHQE